MKFKRIYYYWINVKFHMDPSIQVSSINRLIDDIFRRNKKTLFKYSLLVVVTALKQIVSVSVFVIHFFHFQFHSINENNNKMIHLKLSCLSLLYGLNSFKNILEVKWKKITPKKKRCGGIVFRFYLYDTSLFIWLDCHENEWINAKRNLGLD